ncbi:DNRLRE domain-containing protein [Planctomycetota bacterium]
MLTLFVICAFSATTNADFVTARPADATTYITAFNSMNATPHGGNAAIIVDSAGSETSHVLIGFTDLFSGLANTVPAGATIHSAMLNVTTNGNASGENIGVRQVSHVWDAATTTWDNFGATAGGSAPEDYFAAAGPNFTPSAANTAFSIDITSIVANWAANTSINHGVILVSQDSGSDGAEFFASGSMAPSIDVNFTAVPEPNAFLMLGLVGLTVGGTRWWKSRKK